MSSARDPVGTITTKSNADITSNILHVIAGLIAGVDPTGTPMKKKDKKKEKDRLVWLRMMCMARQRRRVELITT